MTGHGLGIFDDSLAAGLDAGGSLASRLPDIEEVVAYWGRRDPARPAIVAADDCSRLTYGDLAATSRAVAYWLVKEGDAPEEPVPLLTSRTGLAVAAMLGSLRARRTFVPLDPDLPLPRLRIMLEQLNATTFVTDRKNVSLLAQLRSDDRAAFSVLNLDELRAPDGEEARAEELPRPDREASPGRAYVYYTSGSTGRPKGIEGCRRALGHVVEYLARRLGVVGEDRFSQIVSLGFDFCLKELFVPLLRGASVWMAPGSMLRDVPRLVRWLTENRITVFSCPTPLLSVLAEVVRGEPGALEPLRCLLISGDLLRESDLSRFLEGYSGAARLFNLYGPTESTVIKLCHEIEREPGSDRATVPLGKAIEGARALVVDDAGLPTAVGVAGEIWLESPYLALGYFNDPVETARRFSVGADGTCRYRTGDLGRVLEDGTIEFVGRRDRQIKVQGNRIEPEEIEFSLREHPAVDEAAVVASTDDRGTLLTAFLVGSSPVAVAEVRRHLSEKLPAYMTPQRFVQIDSLPRLRSGKVDYGALGEQFAELAATAAMPSADLSSVECELRALWQKLLGRSEVGVEENFFELGGHSLLGVRMLVRIYADLGVKLQFGDLLMQPTIRQIAGRVEAARVCEAD